MVVLGVAGNTVVGWSDAAALRVHHGFWLPSRQSSGVAEAVTGSDETVHSYPNPFRSNVTIAFTLPRPGRVRVAVYDASGRRMRLLLDEIRPEGRGSVEWDATDDTGEPVAAGTYFYTFEAMPGTGGGAMLSLRRMMVHLP